MESSTKLVVNDLSHIRCEVHSRIFKLNHSNQAFRQRSHPRVTEYPRHFSRQSNSVSELNTTPTPSISITSKCVSHLCIAIISKQISSSSDQPPLSPSSMTPSAAILQHSSSLAPSSSPPRSSSASCDTTTSALKSTLMSVHLAHILEGDPRLMEARFRRKKWTVMKWRVERVHGCGPMEPGLIRSYGRGTC